MKRYAVGNFKLWSYAVHRPKIKKYAVRKGEGEGFKPFSLPLINSLNKTEAANFPCIFAFWGLSFFSQINYIKYVKLVCVISQYTAESTYYFIFSLSLFGFKMDLKCTYAV